MCLPRPARRRNAGSAWSSIWRSGSTSRSIEVTGSAEERKLALAVVREIAKR